MRWTPHTLPTIEPVESRQHLAVTTIPSQPLEPSATFNLRINFAPAKSEPVRGYRLDYGASFSRRSNGYSYGWSRDVQASARFSNSPLYDSTRAETNIAMGSAQWNVSVPNGWYEVRILMGDPKISNAEYRLDAEGQPLVKGAPYEGFPWVEGLATIRVTDGKLTLSSDARAVNNRICSLAIRRTAAPVATPKGVSIDWTLNTALKSPLHRAEAASVRVGDRLYVMGGFHSQYERVTGRVDILNLRTNSWSKGAPLPGAQTHFGAASDGNFIYIAGGQYGPMLSKTGTTQAWKYDIANNRWSKFINLPAVRFGGQMSLVNGRLHFVGGDDKTRVRAQTEHWILDLSKPGKGWYAGASLPSPTDHHSQIVVNNQLYVLGGEVEHGTSYLQNDGFFRYDANANRWRTLAPLPEASSHFEAATLTDGKRIFVIAGQTNAQQLTSQVRSYDIANNRWQMHTSLPTARKAGVAWIIGNRLFYMTGDDESSGEPRSTYVGVIG